MNDKLDGQYQQDNDFLFKEHLQMYKIADEKSFVKKTLIWIRYFINSNCLKGNWLIF